MIIRRWRAPEWLALMLGASMIMAGAGATYAAAATGTRAAPAAQYMFTSVASPSDPTFTQLLGINDPGTIAGYYGSGASGHPNKGFTLSLPDRYTPENYPHSAQTQVIGIDDRAETGGFWVDAKGTNHGFVAVNGRFTSVDDPKGGFNQVLGVNHGVAVGTYQDAKGVFHPYLYNFNPRLNPTLPVGFSELPVANAQATGFAHGDLISGFSTSANGAARGFLLRFKGQGGHLSVTGVQTLSFPTQGVTVTQALGVNFTGQVVGQYADAQGTLHGFLYNAQTHTYQSIDFSGTTQDGKPATATTVNGINNRGLIVGFYTAANGNTVGFRGVPNITS